MRHHPDHRREKIVAVVEQAYRAATRPEEWNRFCQRLAGIVDGSICSIHLQDVREQRGRVGSHWGIGVEWQQRHDTYYCFRNVFLQRSAAIMRTGCIILGRELIDDSELRRTEYFNDFLRPIRAGDVAAACIFRERSVVAMMSTFRPLGAAPLGAEDVSVLRMVVPHVQSALAIHRRLSGLLLEERAAWQALDRLPYGVGLLDDGGRLLFANHPLEEVLRAGDGLSTSTKRLAALGRRDGIALTSLLHGVCAAGAAHSLRPAGALIIERPSGKRPYVVLAGSVVIDSGSTVSRPAAVVFVTDPETTLESPSELLQRLYRLTAAEAAIAALLLTGATPAECAQRLGVTMPTIRTHLRRLFEKTGTRRQSGLVRLLMSDAVLLKEVRRRVV